MPEIKQNQWSFAALDMLVNDETSLGLQPVMNIKFAPTGCGRARRTGKQARSGI